MATIQRADPGAKRKAVWMVSIAVLLGLSAMVAFGYFRADFESWLQGHIGFILENSYLAFIASLVLVSPIIAAGVYLLVLGNRTFRARRFPPPGYAVSRDTMVLEGTRAVTRARLIQALSVLLIAAAGSIPFFTWYLFRQLATVV